MAIGDFYKMTLRMTFTGVDTIVNTFHYRQDTIPIFDTPSNDLAEAWLEEVWPTYKAFLSARIVLQVIEVRPVDPAGDFWDESVGENGTGGSGDIVPLTSAPLVTWRTGLIGRTNRGRVYLPPPPEANQDGGSLTSGYKTAIQDWAALNFHIPSSLTHAEWTQVIHNPEGANTNPEVTGFIVRDIMGVQRRRKQGVGG